MNKAQIKAELRRSACEDDDPASGINDAAYFAARKVSWECGPRRTPYDLHDTDDHRIFFLLVAEAL